MANNKRHSRPAPILRRSSIPRRRAPGDARPEALDWPAWLALIDRKRRLLQRHQTRAPAPIPDQYFVSATHLTFALEGIEISEQEVIEAITHGPAKRKFRSRAAQRIRNHVAILRSIETALRLGHSLKTPAVVRWYTSISSGLSMTELAAARMARLEGLVRRINSPQLRLQPALHEIIRAHRELLTDPLFPSFNGILCRLLLRYHLGRCGLPFAVLDFVPLAAPSENRLAVQLLTGIDAGYDMLLA